MSKFLFCLTALLLLSCGENGKNTTPNTNIPTLNPVDAERLAALPLRCIDQEYPYKLGQTLGSADDLSTPSDLHPAFFGCFDWHSAVHGHWSLVALLKKFPNLVSGDLIKEKLALHITPDNIQKEVAYFLNRNNRNFERTYGWAWLLKLADELHTWDDPLARKLENNLRPLSDLMVEKYLAFLPKLVYPIRSGTHPNTAFGLAFAYDYAQNMGIDSLIFVIKERCLDYYFTDINCPLAWEPSGSDFLSPCFEEVDIMRRVLPEQEFLAWLKRFLPQIFEPNFRMEPGVVSDREDGQLVHLDGVNFSRAWCLYGLANDHSRFAHLANLADEHVHHSLASITNDHYEGGHWLASFAILAQNTGSNLNYE